MVFALRLPLALFGLLLTVLPTVPPAGAVPACIGDCNDNGAVDLSELITGVSHALRRPESPAMSVSFACSAFDADDDGQVAIDELVAAVNAALTGCPLVPVEFAAALEPGGAALLLTPREALRGGATYAVVVTTGVKDAQGRALRADADFAALVGGGAGGGDGPVARFDADPEAAGNPYPEARLVRGDGRVHVPDRFALRGVDDTPGLAMARQVLRRTADELEALRGFSTTAPVRIALSAAVDLATVDAGTVRFFAVPGGRADLDSVLRAAVRLGVRRGMVALALAFPTQPIEDDLLAIRADLIGRALRDPPEVILTDPNPDDDLALGVFGPHDAAFGDFLAAHPAVAAVVHGLVRAPDYRAANGVFDAAKVSGERPATDVLIDFLLTVPAGPGPHRAVVMQHGFAGSNAFAVTDLGADLAARGLAGIAISALAHGRRGNPLDLLRSTPVLTRDLFRQTIADQMSLVRAIEAGIDVDGDGRRDIDPAGLGYLGQSLGGILGATFIAVEDTIQAAVLNVAGGRVAFLGNNPGTRPIFAGYLAEQAGLDIANPEFEVFLQRMLELGQHGLDPADGLNFARRWHRDPFPGAPPRRVLMQEGIGDALVANESTEVLAAAGGLPADVALQDANGASALWRFDNPGGHGILGRADVAAQAVAFLASGGTSILDPAGLEP